MHLQRSSQIDQLRNDRRGSGQILRWITDIYAQAHFMNELRTLTGITPGDYLSSCWRPRPRYRSESVFSEDCARSRRLDRNDADRRANPSFSFAFGSGLFSRAERPDLQPPPRGLWTEPDKSPAHVLPGHHTRL